MSPPPFSHPFNGLTEPGKLLFLGGTSLFGTRSVILGYVHTDLQCPRSLPACRPQHFCLRQRVPTAFPTVGAWLWVPVCCHPPDMGQAASNPLPPLQGRGLCWGQELPRLPDPLLGLPTALRAPEMHPGKPLEKAKVATGGKTPLPAQSRPQNLHGGLATV